MTLEELIKDAARRGELNHLSMIATNNGDFSASFRTATSNGHSFGSSKDPIEALCIALKGAKMVRAPRGPSHKPTDPRAAEPDADMDFG